MTTGHQPTGSGGAGGGNAGTAHMDRSDEVRVAVLLGGPLTALGIVGALVNARDQLGAANVGFVMMLVVLAAGLLAGRLAGIVTALVAALAYNVFHTQPYLSVVAAREDVISVALLAAAAAAIGGIGSRAGRLRRQVRELMELQREADAIGQTIAARAGHARSWPQIRAFVLNYSDAIRCEFCRDIDLVQLSTTDLDHTVIVPVQLGGKRVGQLLVSVPGEGVGRSSVEAARRAATLLSLAFAVEGSVPDRLAARHH